MRSVKGTLNKVELIGRLGADPELRMLGNGSAVCRFNLATNRFGGQDEKGNRQIETEWISVEAWERLAELCNSYLGKGRRVRVSGSLRTDSWTDKESGQQRFRTYVRADGVMFLDSRPDQPEQVEVAEDEVPF